MLYKKIGLILIFILSIGMTNRVKTHRPCVNPYVVNVLQYENVWGTIYHAESKQCDNSPTVTGDGSNIDTLNASGHRWIAISQEMLNSTYRSNLINDTNSTRFKGTLRYGDTVWVDSPHKEINGWWVVKDAKNSSYKKSIDFLQTKGDGSLYNDNKLWSGKFKNITIYKKTKKIINHE